MNANPITRAVLILILTASVPVALSAQGDSYISGSKVSDVMTGCAAPLPFIWYCATACIPPLAGSRLRSERREARTRGTWKRRPALALRAAGRWYSREDRAVDALAEGDGAFTVPVKARRKAWARLLAKVYEIDVLCCPRCGARMMVIAVVRDPESIRTIIACINSKGRGPP